jgi:hypothetical protein
VERVDDRLSSIQRVLGLILFLSHAVEERSANLIGDQNEHFGKPMDSQANKRGDIVPLHHKASAFRFRTSLVDILH